MKLIYILFQIYFIAFHIWIYKYSGILVWGSIQLYLIFFFLFFEYSIFYWFNVWYDEYEKDYPRWKGNLSKDSE